MKISIVLVASLLTSCFGQTKNEKLEAELVKIKNQAFCDCYSLATKKEQIKYKDGSSYIQIIDLKEDILLKMKITKK